MLAKAMAQGEAMDLVSETTGRVPFRTLATARLLLRPSDRGDAARAVEIQSDFAVTRMLRMARFPPDPAETEAWFSDHRRQWQAGTAYRFAVLCDDRMIGLVDIDEVAGGEGDLGYWFEAASWGKGYASEAAAAVVAFAFGEAGLIRLRSGHAADNPASGRVLARLGFRPGAATLRPSRSRGGEVMHQSYALDRAAG